MHKQSIHANKENFTYVKDFQLSVMLYSSKGLSCNLEKQPRWKTLPNALLKDVLQAVHVITAIAPAPKAALLTYDLPWPMDVHLCG